MEIREYKSSDRDKICKLFTELSDYKRDIDFWVWSNRIIGTDDSIVIDIFRYLKVGKNGNINLHSVGICDKN